MNSTPAAIAAANWWAEQIGAPVFKATSGREPRAEREPMEMASIMQTLIASRTSMTGEQAAQFAEVLAVTISERSGRSKYGVSIGGDYGPDMILPDAATAAGISLSRFPWKTNMWVYDTHVVVSAGYQAQAALIWQAEDWVRPQCGSHRYGPAPEYEATDDVCTLLQYHDGDHGDFVLDNRQCIKCGRTYAEHYACANGERLNEECYEYEVTR